MHISAYFLINVQQGKKATMRNVWRQNKPEM